MPPGRVSSLLRGRGGDSLVVWAVAGAGTALVISRAPFLADAPACRGLLDLITVIASRTWRDVAIGSILAILNGACLFLGLLLGGRVLLVATSSRLATLATGLAAATSPLLLAPWSPTPAAAVAACCACWFTAGRVLPAPPEASRSLAATMTMVIAFAIASAIVPPLGIPFGAVAGWLTWRTAAGSPSSARLLRAAGAAVVVPAIGAVVVGGLSSSSPGAAITACMAPVNPIAARGVLTQLAAAVGATPLPIGLAFLGLWVSLPPRAGAGRSAMAVTIVVIGASLFGARAAAAFAPAVLLFWVLCASGLAEVRSALAGTAGRRAGAMALATALVCLQIIRSRSAEIPIDLQPQGHYALTRNTYLGLVDDIPDGGTLLAEDAVTDLLARALPGRARRRLHGADVDRDHIAVMLPHSRVYALPRAQRRLQHLGFRLDAVNQPLAGLAEVRPGDACSGPVSTRWESVPQLVVSDQFTMSAEDARARGPVYLFLAANDPLSAQPVDWPPGTTRGFHPRSYTMAESAAARGLAEDAAAYGAAGAIETLASAPHVARVEMWRTPDAPPQLSVNVGARPTQVMARLADDAAAHRVRLCPSIRYDIRPIGP